MFWKEEVNGKKKKREEKRRDHSSIMGSSGVFVVAYCSFILILTSINVRGGECWMEDDEAADRIKNHLPGQPPSPLPITHFSGYVTVNEDHGRALFYWFFQAESRPSKAPLLLWLNGGPGCSSIGYGAAVELGPLILTQNGDALHFNPYAWNREANLLFVESPVGVGFSYTNTSSDLTNLDDAFVAEDAYNFLVNWMKRFPQYKSHDFFISGESYAGHYVPQLAELVYDRNKYTNRTKYPFINLKGFIVGNPETNDEYDDEGVLEYAWSHAVISDQLYSKCKEVCDFKLAQWSPDCNHNMGQVFSQYSQIDIYNIYAPSCLLTINTTTTTTDHQVNGGGFRRMRVPGGYDPCYSIYAAQYFNRPDVKLALHANPRTEWKTCSDSILDAYHYNVFSVLPIYTKLIKAGLRIWVYSGDADGRVPVIGTRYCLEALSLPVKAPWRSWYHNQQVGGRIVEYEGLTYLTVRGAGHLVPLNKPSQAFALIHSFLNGASLPLHPHHSP